jgi:hypothetical protein
MTFSRTYTASQAAAHCYACDSPVPGALRCQASCPGAEVSSHTGRQTGRLPPARGNDQQRL